MKKEDIENGLTAKRKQVERERSKLMTPERWAEEQEKARGKVAMHDKRLAELADLIKYNQDQRAKYLAIVEGEMPETDDTRFKQLQAGLETMEQIAEKVDSVRALIDNATVTEEREVYEGWLNELEKNFRRAKGTKI